MRKLVCLILILSGFMASAQYKNQNIVAPLPKNLEKVLLVDVRKPTEFEAGHINGAKNIDWFSEGFDTAFAGLKKRQKIYVYCRSGKRSAKAAARLDSLGFKRVINLTGGYNAFKEAQ